jgi:hypothetical protein
MGFWSKAASIARNNIAGVGSAAYSGAAQSAAFGSAAGQFIGNAAYGATSYMIGGGTKNALLLYIMVIAMHFFDFFIWGFTPNHMRVLIYLWVVLLILWQIGQKNQKIGTSLVLVFVALFQSAISAIIFSDYNFTALKSFSLSMYNMSTLLNYSYWIGFIILGLLLLKKMNQEIEVSYVFVYLYLVAILPYLRGWAVVWDLLATPFFGGVQTFVEIFLYIIPPLWWFLGSKEVVPPRFLSVLMNIGLILLLLIFLFSNFSAIAAGGNQALMAQGIDSVSLLRNVGELVVSSYEQGRVVLTTGYNQTRDQFNTELRRAQGKDFESDVERANYRSVGLSLGDIQISPDKPKVGDIITFSSRLEVLSFDTPVRATANCSVANTIIKPPFRVNGNIVQETFFIRDYANNFVVCRLNRNEISEPKSGYTVNMSIEFDYVASAYLRRYFLKPGLLRTLPSGGTTVYNPESLFFSTYGLGTVPKQSTRTNGPVDLAIRTPNVIVELEDGIEQSPFLIEVGLESARVNWKGQLQEAHQIILSVPKEFEVLRDEINPEKYECNDGGTVSRIEILAGPSCSAFNPSYDVPDLNCDHYDHIVFTPMNRQVGKDLVVSCFIKPRDSRSLLQDASFAQVSFQARAAYKYQLQQSKIFSVAEPPVGYEPLEAASLKTESVCGDVITTQAKFDYSKRFSVSQIRSEYEEVLRLLDSTALSANEKQAYAGASCHARLIAQSIVLNDYDLIKPYVQFGKVQIPGSFGPLRMTVQKYDELVRLGILESPISQSSQNQQQNQTNTSTQNEFSGNQTTSLQSSPQQLTYEQKMRLLEQNGFAYSLKYLEHLISECKMQTGGSFDPSCVIGKYNCGQKFVWGDLNSCSSFDMCRFCMNTYVPAVYTYYREIGYVTSDSAQRVNTQSSQTSTQNSQITANDGILII